MDTPAVLHLFPHWNWQEKPDAVIPVICYTNCDTVELFLNGKSFGVKAYEFPMQGMTERYGHFDLPHIATTTNDLHLRWDVPYEVGILEAVGRTRQGDIVTRTVIQTTGDAVNIEADLDAVQDLDQSRVALINIRITDIDGQVVPTADPLITVRLEGPATLIGLDNGNPEDKTQMQSATRRTMAGLAMAVIRITDPGQPVCDSPDR
jgi:beta-galactosidase